MIKITNIFRSSSGRWYWTVKDTAKCSSITYHTDREGDGMLVDGMTGEIRIMHDGSKYAVMDEKIIEDFNGFTLHHCTDREQVMKEVRKYLKTRR